MALGSRHSARALKGAASANAKPAPSGGLKVTATGPKQARAGSKVNVRVRVRNASGKRATKVVACVAKTCRMIGTIPAGEAKKIKLSPKIGRKASGNVSLAVKAKGKGVKPGTAQVRVRVS